jgi:hypothetical protein
VSVEGSAQVRKEGSRQWETLKKGAQIEDNDQIQTAFKGRCEISDGADNTILLGSSSRMLVNVTLKADKSATLGVSLLNGSVYTKLTKGQGYSIFTSSAKASTDAAIFNCTVDEITGITGFHVFRGAIAVQNISIQGTQELRPGETATVAPSTPPSIPRKITTQQMSVLTRFYGSDFINQELKASGLELESSTSSSRSSVSVDAKVMDAKTDQKKTVVTSDTKKSSNLALMTKENAEKKVSDYMKTRYLMFTNPARAEPLKQYKYRMEINGGGALNDDVLYPSFDLMQAFYWKQASIAIHLPVVSNEAGGISLQIGTLRSVLDKIYYADATYKNSKISIGTFDNIGMGNNMLIRNYSNKAKADNLRNLALSVNVDGFFNHLHAFTSSVADAHLSVVNFYADDPSKRYEVTVVQSREEKLNTARGDFGFMAEEGTLQGIIHNDSLPHSVSRTAFEIGGGMKLLNERPYKFDMKFSYAGIVNNETVSLEGYSLLIPSFTVVIKRVSFDTEFFVTGNRFIRGYFGQMYEDNHYSIARDSTGLITGANTLYEMIDKVKFNAGTRLAMRLTPVYGAAISVEWEKILSHHEKVMQPTEDSTAEPVMKTERVSGRNDGAFEMRLQIGDGFVVPSLLWFDAFYRIERIGYFEDGKFDPFTPNPFTLAGAEVVLLIRKNINASVLWERFYYDRNGNFISESDEKVDAFKLGVHVGF